MIIRFVERAFTLPWKRPDRLTQCRGNELHIIGARKLYMVMFKGTLVVG
jgi:hypothetical protein